MPDRRAVSVLDTHLWSLRAEVEAQLRSLTEVHRQIHHLSRRDDPQWTSQVARIAAHLEQILDGNVVIRELCVTALGEARAIELL